MSGIVIVTDSSSDLPIDEAERLGILVVPLSIRFGAEEYVDRADLSPAEFWAKCKDSSTLPETAAPSPGAFQAAFEEARSAGASGVICITISSELSATYQSALTAAKAMVSFPVTVVDSQLVTLPLGLLVLDAAEAAAKGATMDNVVDEIHSTQQRIDVVFTLNTLEHLKKGGRIGAAQALLGSVLSIKPILTLKDGKVEEEGRQRTRAKSMEHLARLATEAAPFERLAVVHGDAEDVSVLIDRLSGLESDVPLIVGDIGPVVGTHGGPGVVGVSWIRRA